MEPIKILIKDGLVFDGSQNPAKTVSILIENGKIKKIGESLLSEIAKDVKVIDAKGKWVTPGFIDIHTHYDAEIEAIPSLSESLRHGVTTVFLGSCSLSVALGEAEDIADTFTRVEAIPKEHLLPLLKKKKTWKTMTEYVEHFKDLPIGPNVASFVGYSNIRSYVMGLERSLTVGEKPTEEEMRKMESLIEEGFQAGCIGLSLNTLYWDKMGGERFNSRCLPSTYASWKEIARMVKLARKHNLILQAIPNISTKYEVFIYALFSAGAFFRKSLKTTLVSIMDIRSNRMIYKVLEMIGTFFNKILRADFRYQALPTPFDLYADGVDLVVFEEFGAGAAALNLQTAIERKSLFQDEKYRSWFRRQWANPFIPKVFHRNFNMAIVQECPDKTLVGKSFSQIASETGKHVVDTFLDLVIEFGTKIRWYTMMGNDRPKHLSNILNHEAIVVGFSDAGAHLRNMAYYNFPLRMLKFVKDSENTKMPAMSLEKAVWRLTGELADWFNIDAGYLKEGARADLVVIDPQELDDSVDEIHEEPIVEFGNYKRLVRRNDKVVKAVIVNGKMAVEEGKVLSKVGKEKAYGEFLKSKK